MKFGGATQFGTGAFGGDPFGFDPGFVCDRMIATLSRFKIVNGVGRVKTVKRLMGDLSDQAAIDRHLFEGVPAFLVWYQGGVFPNTRNTQRNKYDFTAALSIICIGGDFANKLERQQGRNAYAPSTDNLMRWATRFCGVELDAIKQIRVAKPAQHSFVRWIQGQYIGRVDFELTTCGSDIVDSVDLTAARFERLGIVHNPLDLNELFKPDNSTPNSDDPVGGGDFELEN